MHIGPLRRGAIAAGAAVLAGALALSACGEKKEQSKAKITPKGGADSSLAAKVPAAVKADGTIKLGTDATYAPYEFLDTDNKTIIGYDIDLFDAVAAKLGLKTQYTTAPFDSLITGVQSGKYEAAISSFTITSDREKQVNMVSYDQAGTQWLVKSGNPAKINPDDACGKKVAVQKATTQVEEDVPKRQAACKKAGKPAIQVDQFQGQDQATTAVVSGKDDAMLADSPIVQYAAKKLGGKVETLGNVYDSAPHGIVVPKNQQQFAQAIQGAVQALINDGTLKQIVGKWGLKGGQISSSAVNPQVS